MKRPIGHVMEIVIKKNKTAPPNRTAGFTFFFNGHDTYPCGASNASEQIVKQAEFWGLIKRTGAWYQLAKDIKVQGSEGAAEKLNEMPKLRNMLLERINAKETEWVHDG